MEVHDAITWLLEYSHTTVVATICWMFVGRQTKLNWLLVLYFENGIQGLIWNIKLGGEVNRFGGMPPSKFLKFWYKYAQF